MASPENPPSPTEAPASDLEPGHADIFVPWTRNRTLQKFMRPAVQAYHGIDRLVQVTGVVRVPYRLVKKLIGVPFRLVRLLNAEKSIYRFSKADYWMYLFGRSVFDSIQLKPLPSEHDGLAEYQIRGRRFFWPDASPATDLAHSLFEVLSPARRNPLTYEVGDILIEAGDHVLDVGACEGFFAHRALEAGAAHVALFEPVPVLQQCLTLSFAAELEQGRALLSPVLLGDTEGETSIDVDLEFLAGSKRGEGGLALSCRRVSLDVLAAEAGLERIDFIKMDVEGDEVVAVRGARETIQRHKPKLAIAVYHGHENAAQIRDLLQEWVPDYQVRFRGLFQKTTLPTRPCVLFARCLAREA